MVKRDFGQEPITNEEVLNCYWYPVIDNLIGGWAVSNVNMTTADLNPYEGQFELGSFLAEYEAKHIAGLHNTWYLAKVYESYRENIEYSWYWEVVNYYHDLPTEPAPLTEDDWFDYSDENEAT